MSSDSGHEAASDIASDRELSAKDLARLGDVPRGAAALAGTSVLLLLLAWVVIYLAIYLPRGMVG